MKDTEMLAEIRAREQIEALGYKLVDCERCYGRGVVVTCGGLGSAKCWKCDGRGKTWKAPITK